MPDLPVRLQAALADRYTIEQELGRGAMATVYLAHDLKHHRKVAIKALKPEIAAALGPDRFLREIDIAARLTHPHIVPLFDSGEANGFLFYVMPYVAGETVRRRLERERQLPLDDALRITREVAEALDYAHRQGLVHRDVKPENILLADGQAVVADFGVARAVAAAGAEKLTETGLAVGTPAYMSPEQASGETQLDGRSDIYSLGCVLYEMLAGEPPFTGPSVQAVLARHSLDPVPRLRTVRSTVPEVVEHAITKALAKVPADRFATATEFAEGLVPRQTAAAQQQVSVGTPGVGEAPAAERPESPVLPSFSRSFVGAGAVGLVLFFALYRLAYPPPIAAPTISRDQAVALARQFLKAQGAAGSFTEGVRFDANRSERIFLERALGRARARDWVREELPLGLWHLRWFQPLQTEEWQVGIANNGTVVEFQRTLEESAPEASVSQDSARAVATTFLRGRGWDLSALERIEASSQQRPRRIDHQFAWQKRGTMIAWRDAKPGSGNGTIRVSVEVQGDKVGSYRHELRTPPEIQRAIERSLAVRVILLIAALIGLGGAAVGVVFARQRRKEVRWALALRYAVCTALAVLLIVIQVWDLIRSRSPADTASIVLLDAFSLLLAVASLVAVLLAVAAADVLARRTRPAVMTGYAEALRGQVASEAVGRACVAGCVLGAALLGYHALARAAAGYIPGAWSLSESGAPDALQRFIPALTPLLASLPNAMVQGAFMLLVLALASRFRSSWLASLPAALLWTGMTGSVFPFFASVLVSGVPFLIVWFGLTRLGVLAGVVALYVQATLPMGVSMVNARGMGLGTSGVVVLALALLPLVPVAMARLTGRWRGVVS